MLHRYAAPRGVSGGLLGDEVGDEAAGFLDLRVRGRSVEAKEADEEQTGRDRITVPS